VSFAGTPPKNSNAATCASTQTRPVMLTAGQMNRCREYGSTIENAHTRRRRPVDGSGHRPRYP